MDWFSRAAGPQGKRATARRLITRKFGDHRLCGPAIVSESMQDLNGILST